MSDKYVVVDCCPVPAADGFAGDVELALTSIGATLASAYRGTDPGAAKYLTGQAPCFKHTQVYLYAHQGEPGIGPANPPGFSTHELFNDGVAYPVARGAKLEPWQCGLDIDDAHVAAFCAAARRRGWIVTITYPTSPLEHHHVNFRKRPTRVVITKLGDSGPAVNKLIRQLAYIERPNHPGDTYLSKDTSASSFTKNVEDAVKEFQGDHHQAPDGEVGPHTRAQLEVAQRREKVRHRIDHLKVKLHNAEDAVKNAQTDAQRKQQARRVKKLENEIRKLGGRP